MDKSEGGGDGGTDPESSSVEFEEKVSGRRLNDCCREGKVWKWKNPFIYSNQMFFQAEHL